MSEEPGAREPHDGIEEHDHHLPRWWLLTLFGSMVFSLVYWSYYHALSAGTPQLEELRADERALAAMREAQAPPESDDSLLASSRDSGVVERGKAIFAQNCVACHGARAEGGVGPNLTDAYWLHGGSPLEIKRVISKGVVDKGMLAWGNVLGASKVSDVAAFVISLKDTNVAGKEPQGQKLGAR